MDENLSVEEQYILERERRYVRFWRTPAADPWIPQRPELPQTGPTFPSAGDLWGRCKAEPRGSRRMRLDSEPTLWLVPFPQQKICSSLSDANNPGPEFH